MKNSKVTKAHRIIFCMTQVAGPITRKLALQQAWAMEGKNPGEFRETSNKTYFNKRNSYDARRTGRADAAALEGLVTVTGKVGNRITYTYTGKGLASIQPHLAQLAQEWANSCL
jgi:hypothetical protein